MFFDFEHAAEVYLGSSNHVVFCAIGNYGSTTSCSSGSTRVSLTLCHVFSHGGNVGSRCADHAAAMRAFGCVSSFNLVERSLPDRTLPLLKVEPAAFVDI